MRKKVVVNKTQKGGNKKTKSMMDPMRSQKLGLRQPIKTGGPAKKSKFPDHSGDGKITKKDILMAKGVIPKKKNKTRGRA